MRIIDGWYINIITGTTWGFDSWVTGVLVILIIITGIACLEALHKASNITKSDKIAKAILIGFVVISCGFIISTAAHTKPVYKQVLEYKIECTDVTANKFFEVFELQEQVDETHYIVRQKNWRDQLN